MGASAISPNRPAQPAMSRLERIVWWSVFILVGLPALHLAVRTFGGLGGLGVNPIETLVRDSGTYAIYTLLLVLAVTPVYRLTGWSPLVKLRRLLGLTAFAYASLHLGLWLGVDLYFAWDLAFDDLTHRPFIMVGMAAWVILLILAVTSSSWAVRYLKHHWRRLQLLVYPAAILAVLHIFWLTRADYDQVIAYAAVLALLLGLRVVGARG